MELVCTRFRYKPEEHGCWKAGPVPYMHIAATFAAMDGTTKRLRIGDALTNMFRSVLAICPEDLEAVAYLTVGKLAPDYAGVDLQVGGATVSSAIADSTGVHLEAPSRGAADLVMCSGGIMCQQVNRTATANRTPLVSCLSARFMHDVHWLDAVWGACGTHLCSLSVRRPGLVMSNGVSRSPGVTPRRMSQMYVEAGDLGDVAEKCKSKQRMLVPHPPLTASGVFAKLHDIANSKGNKSAQRKQGIISGLLRASRFVLGTRVSVR